MQEKATKSDMRTGASRTMWCEREKMVEISTMISFEIFKGSKESKLTQWSRIAKENTNHKQIIRINFIFMHSAETKDITMNGA